jgi:tetratricopeptide (TPR) repeat protein
MLAEKIIFNILAFSLFVFIFFKMIKKNDSNYVIILCMEAIGIAINFIEIIFKLQLNVFFRIIVYLLSIIIPIVVIYIEHKKINFSELIYIMLAMCSAIVNNTKSEKNFLIKLVTKYPESYMGHKMLAKLYEKEGGMRKAIDEYVQVIDINKQDYESYYRISYLLNELDKKDEASQMLEKLLDKKPDMLEATQLLGDIYCEQERYKEAASMYNDALKYNPTSYDLYYNLGIVYTMLNDFQNAKMCYEKAATINTLSYNSYYSLGQINFIYNDLNEAEKYFMQSVQGQDVEAKGYYNLAKIYMIRGDKENAIKFLNVAIEVEPKIYKKAEIEPLFNPIKGYMNFPNLEEAEERKINLTAKELKVQKHLSETTKLVGKLSRNEQKSNTEYERAEKEQNKEKERDE